MKKNIRKTGFSIALCIALLVTCFFPASVTALEGTAMDKQETQQSQQTESQDEQKATSQDSQKQSTESDAKAASKTKQQDMRGLDDTQTRAALSSVMAKDKNGNALCYTTLYDSKDRIVDTNDPKKKQDDYYKPESEGGKGGTVDLGASLKVSFRMAEILEHDGDKGIQENTIYYMELPSALVPVEKDKKGKKLVDPDEPVRFFKDGDVDCVGGIYSVDGGYELQMQFENVEDELEISGGFQYGVTVSKDLKPGESCTVDFVPGGGTKLYGNS